MKILQFNILDGCFKDEVRLKMIGDFIVSNSYDIVGLNEAPSNIDDVAKEWNYNYSQIAIKENRESFVAILSKYPIQLLDIYGSMFHHSVIHVSILKTHFMVTHLTPHDSLAREREASLIKDITLKINTPLMIMGDLNNLSPLDKEKHEQNRFKQILQNDESLRKKFLNSEGEINYKPIEYLLEIGLLDIFNKLGASNNTVPTLLNKDVDHFTGMRLDYMLVNNHFSDNLKVRVIEDSLTNSLSDHYPLECVLE